MVLEGMEAHGRASNCGRQQTHERSRSQNFRKEEHLAPKFLAYVWREKILKNYWMKETSSTVINEGLYSGSCRIPLFVFRWKVLSARFILEGRLSLIGK